MPHQVPLRPGDPRRLGRYRLGGRIEGIPSDDPVFIGLSPDGHEVAISLLRGDWAHDGAARDRFAAEAAVAKRVPPFCAARVLDAGLDGQDAYLVSEYVPGPSLLELVAAEDVRHGHDLDAVAIAMATGLASVHQAGLVHGNFGPQYVIMAPGGPPRVIEYGITPPYGAATPSSDMLAWAQTVVFAAVGRPPARMDDLEVLPEHIRQSVEQCLDPEPSERPAARAVVLNLLGDAELPGGLLAEGARRAARSASHAAYDPASDQLPDRLAPRSPHHERAGHGDRPATGSLSARGGAPAYGGVPVERAARTRSAGTRSAGRGGAGRGGGRRTVWLIAAAVVAAVVIGAVVLHSAQGSPGHPSADSKLSSNTVSKSPSPSPSLSPSKSPVTPTDFAGSWSGLVTQPPTDAYNVSVTLKAGKASGTVSYTGTAFRCSGTLQVITAAPAKLTLSQGILQGQSKCEDGTVVITRTGTNTIRFRFGSTGLVASGALHRS